MRFQITRNACIENVGKYQSCMVSKLRIIWKQTVSSMGEERQRSTVQMRAVPVIAGVALDRRHMRKLLYQLVTSSEATTPAAAAHTNVGAITSAVTTGNDQPSRTKVSCRAATATTAASQQQQLLLQHGVAALSSKPAAFQEVLAYRACHAAVRFGDALSHAQCAAIIRKLAQCRMPFQCAHGRPTMIPLLALP